MKEKQNIDYAKYSVHIVDDEQSVISELSKHLKEKGYQVDSSLNGKEALDALQTKKPSLIILNIEMPVMDGFETFKQLKSNKELAEIPVIFHSSLTDKDTIEKIFSMGASDYISKPFIPAEMLARVEKEILTITMQNSLRKKISKLAELITVDTATNTSNRYHIIQQMNIYLNTLKSKPDATFVLLYIDIDGFNSYGKKYGLEASSKSLKKFAGVVKQNVRKEDIVAHWEGDIFIVLLPSVTVDEAHSVAKKINSSVEESFKDETSALTCSIVMLNIDTVNESEKIIGDLQITMEKLKKRKRNVVFGIDIKKPS